MDTTRPSLLLRIRDRRDADSWSTFSTLYRPILVRYALSRGLSQSDAEDVAQHTLLAVHQKIDSFDYDPARGRFKGWLRTIANNRARNLLRDGAAAARARDALAGQPPAGRPESPDEHFDRIWLQEHVWFCLRELQHEIDERDAEIYSLLMFADISMDALCERFAITPGNARTIKYRITRKLADRMRTLAGDDEEGST